MCVCWLFMLLAFGINWLVCVNIYTCKLLKRFIVVNCFEFGHSLTGVLARIGLTHFAYCCQFKSSCRQAEHFGASRPVSNQYTTQQQGMNVQTKLLNIFSLLIYFCNCVDIASKFHLVCRENLTSLLEVSLLTSHTLIFYHPQRFSVTCRAMQSFHPLRIHWHCSYSLVRHKKRNF